MRGLFVAEDVRLSEVTQVTVTPGHPARLRDGVMSVSIARYAADAPLVRLELSGASPSSDQEALTVAETKQLIAALQRAVAELGGVA